MLHPVDALPPEHRVRYQMILADLDNARQVDLTSVSPAALMLTFERLRGALAEAADLIDDLAAGR